MVPRLLRELLAGDLRPGRCRVAQGGPEALPPLWEDRMVMYSNGASQRAIPQSYTGLVLPALYVNAVRLDPGHAAAEGRALLL